MSTPPTGNDDEYTIDEDSLLTVNVENGLLSNDTDAENDPLQVVLVIDEQYHSCLLYTSPSPRD